jgi:hypothetical protein
MKVNIEIECTPVEARQFFGLPNVEPMQDAVMQQLEKRMLADIERISPEALMKNWLAGRRTNARLFSRNFLAAEDNERLDRGIGGRSFPYLRPHSQVKAGS